MKLTIDWLQEFTPYEGSLEEFVHGMTMSGSKVEGFEREAADITEVITCKITDIKPHPDADRLQICTVDDGSGEDRIIVTAARNVAVGLVVPLALPGANLAGGMHIEASPLRGVMSYGMFCSVEELGYTTADFPDAPEDGIYIFPSDTPVGQDAKEALGINQQIVDFEITSNRPDCFSVQGLASEAALTFQLPFRHIDKVPVGTEDFTRDNMSIKVEEPSACPRYMGRLIRNVKIGPSTPKMQRRLRALGMRPVNNIVDITNYVQLALGQPMHAFDLRDIHGRQLSVRYASEGEKMITLDGGEHELISSDLVIADADRAVALAGVMGAENSEIKDDTTDVLFEVANFEPVGVRQTAKRCGIRTESSSRFEKGLSPQLVEVAMNYACYLVEKLGCGEVATDMIDIYAGDPEKHVITYSPVDINSLLGLDISDSIINQILHELGLELTEIEEGIWQAAVPYYRPDLRLKADLAEEVARFYGYDKVPAKLSSIGTPTLGGLNRKQLLTKRIHGLLNAAGAYEAYTSSFASPQDLDDLGLEVGDKLRKAIEIRNPLGVEDSLMRTTLLPDLLRTVSLNLARSNYEGTLYELGKTYHPEGTLESLIEQDYDTNGLPTEIEHLAIIRFERDGKNSDLFYRTKGIVENLLANLGIEDYEFSATSTINYLHPGQTAVLRIDDYAEPIGFIGTIHPRTTDTFDVVKPTVYADLNLGALLAAAKRITDIEPLPKYPSIKRDLALLAPRTLPVNQILKVIRKNGGEYLHKVELFDIYAGSKLGDDVKSVAYSLLFRDLDKTLSDEEINPVIEDILRELQTIGVRLRDI